MRLLLLLLTFAATLPVQAQKPVYAVASLVGDGILVVVADNSVGSLMDRNQREFHPMKSQELDKDVLLAVDQALRERDPAAKPILLGVSNTALREMQARALDERSGAKPMVDAIRPAAQKAGATHLILAVKNRDDARLRTGNGMVGVGKLEGLGFYIDNDMRMVNTETGEGTQGFISPFAYIRFLLVDLGTGATLREQDVIESHAVASQKAAFAWNALAAERKVQLLQHLIRSAVDDAVPELLGKP